MKNTIIAAVAALTMTAGFAAADTGFFGHTEYAFEAQALEFGIGAYTEVQSFTLTAELTATTCVTDGCDLKVSEVTFGASYPLSNKFTAYGELTLDSDFQYNEAVLGVSAKF